MDRQMTGYEKWLPLAVLMAVAFAVFANTFGAEWNYDDFPVIVENPDILSFGNFLADRYPGRPLRELTFVLDHALFGMAPAGWHIQHLFWHGLCGWLLWLLLVRLDFGRTVAWIAALLFLVHPLQVETVASLSHRKESLMLAFCLMALHAYRLGCAAAGGARWGWLAGAFALAGVACLGKQTGVAVFPLFLVYEWLFLPRERWALLRFWKGLALLGAAGAAGFLAWLAFGSGAERYVAGIREVLPFKANWFGEMTWPVMVRTALKAWLFMAAKWVLPVGLAAEYVVAVPAGWLDPWVLGGLLLTAAYLAAVVYLAVRRRPLLFPLLWIGLFYLPTSNLWPLAYLAADRYMYAPTAGVAAVAAIGLVRLCAGRPRAAWVTTAVVLAVLAGLTWRQNWVWATPASLWLHAVEVAPTSGFALNNVGNLHMLEGNLAKAREFYARAIEVNPLNPSAQYNLGLIYEQVGDRPRMFEYYRNFLRLRHQGWVKEQDALAARLQSEYRARFVDGRFVFE